MQFLSVLAIGICAGIMSGLFGIGGGIILVPFLVLVMKFPQQTANGTSLVALLLPVGILGVYEYYKAGKISPDNIRFGLLIALGMFFGTYFGSRAAVLVPAQTLRKAFAVFTAVVSVKIWFT